MRELTTIGNLGRMRAMRAVERASRLMPMRMGYLGATNPSFVAPSLDQVDANPPGGTLSAANVAMLNHFASSGVPSMHDADPFVLAFQKAYNKDGAPWVALGQKLDEDGGYGDNTHDASAALVDYTGGGTPPPVNTGAAVVVAPASPVAPPSPATPSAPLTKPGASSSHVGLWILAIVAAIGAAYAAHKMMKKRRARRRAAPALPSRAIVLT
jgi:hypothetical protein